MRLHAAACRAGTSKVLEANLFHLKPWEFWQASSHLSSAHTTHLLRAADQQEWTGAGRAIPWAEALQSDQPLLSEAQVRLRTLCLKAVTALGAESHCDTCQEQIQLDTNGEVPCQRLHRLHIDLLPAELWTADCLVSCGCCVHVNLACRIPGSRQVFSHDEVNSL